MLRLKPISLRDANEYVLSLIHILGAIKVFLKEVALPIALAFCLASFLKPIYIPDGVCAVSYTHLDVYKRQISYRSGKSDWKCSAICRKSNLYSNNAAK